MSYFITAISNGGGAPEQAYRKMQAAGACPEKPFAGKSFQRLEGFTVCLRIWGLFVAHPSTGIPWLPGMEGGMSEFLDH